MVDERVANGELYLVAHARASVGLPARAANVAGLAQIGLRSSTERRGCRATASNLSSCAQWVILRAMGHPARSRRIQDVAPMDAFLDPATPLRFAQDDEGKEDAQDDGKNNSCLP